MKCLAWLWLWIAYIGKGEAIETPESESNISPDAELNNPRGYPLFFGSFENVGESRVEPNILQMAEVDDQITEWLKGCKADAVLVIRDSTPFDLSQLAQLKRLGEQSLTRGSFLGDLPINMHELALDLEDYCNAKFVTVDPVDPAIPTYSDAQPRVFYIEFGIHDADNRGETLRHVLKAIPSPYVTVIYTSTYAQTRPIFRSLQLDPRRLRFMGHGPHETEKVKPIIAPLFTPKASWGHDASEPMVELPDHFFLTLLVASVITGIFFLYRGIYSN